MSSSRVSFPRFAYGLVSTLKSERYPRRRSHAGTLAVPSWLAAPPNPLEVVVEKRQQLWNEATSV
jgi:hypothetical protein